VALDGEQRPIILEYPADIFGVVNASDTSLDTGYLARVLRLEHDGTLTTLWDGSHTGKAAVAGADGEVLVVTAPLGQEPAKLWAIKPDKTREERLAFSDADGALVQRAEAYGRDARGRIYLGLRDRPGQPPAVYRLDPGAKALAKVADQAEQGWKGLALDASGAVFYLDAAGKLFARRPDGPAIPLLSAPPPDLALTMFCGVALAQDDTAYVRVGTTKVYQAAHDALVPVAGTAGDASGQQAALAEPHGVAVAADGSYYVADKGKHQVLRFTADGQAGVYAGTGSPGYGADGVDALTAPLSSPRTLRLDGQGNLYVAERAPELAAGDLLDDVGQIASLCLAKPTQDTSRIRRISPAGKVQTAFSVRGRVVLDFAAAADGTLYVAVTDPCGVGPANVLVLSPGGSSSSLPGLTGLTSIPALCLGPAGEVFLAADSKLRKASGGAVQVLPATSGVPGTAYYSGTLACDANGRIYIATRIGATVLRYSPNTNTYEGIAGATSFNFTGSGVDDSLKDARYPTFGPDGTLYFSDAGHKQVKRLPPDKLMLGVPQ
jgi:sugar lactone lactonase YvrE